MSKWRKTLAFATVFAILGALFHSLAHGSVSISGLVVIACLSGVLAIPAAQLKISARSLPALIVALFGGQLMIHVLLAVVGHGNSMNAVTDGQLIPGLFMTLMHAIAAIIAAGALYFAEGISTAWARFLASVVGVAVSPIQPVSDRSTSIFAEPCCPVLNVLQRNVLSRGPPLASLAH